MQKVAFRIALNLSLLAFLERGAVVALSDDRAAQPLQYNRDIRPILSNNCFKCHGLDEGARKAGLRLDDRLWATKTWDDGRAAIVPGLPSQSELIRRIVSADDSYRMPPPQTHKKLTAIEIETLRRWIEQGAEYQPHWSFIPPSRPVLPRIARREWPRNPIDHFIAARLDEAALSPSAEADRASMIRRVTLDLTGLPPALSEIDAFLADSSPDAYEKLVDRLLHSPRYGERMALEWLDAARFADTHGYHIDSGRDMTRWRQWVIDAFNQNTPFDRFTVEQIAGDLISNATLQQKIASGFNRNHMINYEGGAIPEEYHVAYIVDRVNTTGTVWLGLTLGCAQCHDHKYDPISQKEYYSLYAFFHNVPENGLDGRTGNAAPVIKLPTPAQSHQQQQLADSIRRLEQYLAGPVAEVDAAQAEWELAQSAQAAVQWIHLDPHELHSSGGAELTKLDDHSIVAGGTNPATETYRVSATTELARITAIRLEALPDDRFTAKGPGRSENGNIVLTDVRVAALPPGESSEPATVKLKAATADFSQKDFPIANAIDDQPQSGWAIHPEVGKPHAAVFEFQSPLGAAADAGGKWSISVTLEFQSRFARHQLGRFRLSATGATNPHELQGTPANIRTILATASDKRSDAQREELQKYYRSNVSPIAKDLSDQLAKFRKEQSDLDRQVATTMVMQEMEQPRDTFLLLRGQYDKKGDKVSAAVPQALGQLVEGAPANRMGLARWLVDPAQPLTTRVMVNRYWQMYFGTGIVKTSEDLGTQGDWPSHPELLDWLATEFRDSGWDVKHIQRLIVTSATYRQSSISTPAQIARDPENRLLARGPRLRLQVEFIRDQALALGGLLNGEIGGSSVSPYQPPGIWEELAYRQDGKNFSAQEYVQSHGPDLYRRTMYTFIKRTAPPPSLVTFDAPDRETCTVRRARTNTPLQALILMNDPTYVEASRKFAERIMSEPAANASLEDRIGFAFRSATGRPPAPTELNALRRLFDSQLIVFQQDPATASKLLAVGESPRDASLDPTELATWSVIASVILNLDETVTKS
jgi:hypothetical protein